MSSAALLEGDACAGERELAVGQHSIAQVRIARPHLPLLVPSHANVHRRRVGGSEPAVVDRADLARNPECGEVGCVEHGGGGTDGKREVNLVDGGQARISEGTVWNIGFWDGVRVVWPQAPALRGTAERLLQLGLAAHGVAQEIRPVSVDELPAFRAAFACNANGVQPVVAIDELDYPDEPELRALLDAAAAHAAWEPLYL